MISTLFLAFFTLVAFAANSILCRMVLLSGSMGAVEFTFVRLLAGIIVLMPLIIFHRNFFSTKSDEHPPLSISIPNFLPALALFGYALFFSLAYLKLEAGSGALILFASVQITMIGVSILEGNRVSSLEWTGILISFAGLVYLMSPGLSAPSTIAATLMIASGVCWGFYSLLGRNQPRPILTTARNFLFCLPGVVILGLIMIVGYSQEQSFQVNSNGLLLAILSGAVASGMGYVLWYLTVRRITTTIASVAQLAVPVLVAIGGILLLDESLTLRLIISSIMIIGGIMITILGGRRTETKNR